jgi:hypothetical protein
MPLQLQTTALKLPKHLLLPIFASLSTVDGFRNAAVCKSVVRAGHAWSGTFCAVETRMIALLPRTIQVSDGCGGHVTITSVLSFVTMSLCHYVTMSLPQGLVTNWN